MRSNGQTARCALVLHAAVSPAVGQCLMLANASIAAGRLPARAGAGGGLLFALRQFAKRRASGFTNAASGPNGQTTKTSTELAASGCSVSQSAAAGLI
ncbi:hypothetical protein N9164_12570 [Draconibacterium sp.]|nr:hypothetical protein [Draconibacterium sp.]